LLLSISNNCVLSFFLKKYEKNFTSLTIDFQPLNNLPQKKSKKSAKKFAELKKRRTFAPANETISALARRNNTYIDIMLYSTKEDLKNRVKPEVNNLKIG